MQHLTEAQKTELKSLIEEKLKRLEEYHASVEAADPSKDSGRMEANESGEDALENYDMTAAEALSEESQQQISELQSALQRMKDRKYGVDETTGEPIPYLRLKFFPTARTNV